MSGRLLVVAVLVLAAGAAVLGWNAGDTAPAPAPQAERWAWSLPQPKPVDLTAALAKLKSRHPWTGLFTFGVPGSLNGAAVPGAVPGAAAAAHAPAPASWRLAGVVGRGADRFALIASGVGPGATLAYLRVGDRLPDGSRLVRIAADSAVVADAKTPAQQRVYRLFGGNR